MLFMMICTDKPDSGAVRAAVRPKHLEYLASVGDKVKLGGPLMAADNQTSIGSVIIVEADSLAAARAIADNDPDAKAGLFESVVLRSWRKVVGEGV